MQSSNAAVLQSANLYVYTVNNPVRWVDPSGLVKKPSLQSALGPAEIGGGGSGRTIGGGSGGGVSVGGGTVSGGRSTTTNIVTARPAPAAQSGTGGGAGTGTATQPREVAPAASGQSGARSGATPGATTQQRAVVPAPQGGGPAPQNTVPVSSIETIAPNAMKASEATTFWDSFLGPNTTNLHPRTQLPDLNRIVSADGLRSIRFGAHEMTSMGTTKAHFHFEVWTFDALGNVTQVRNTIQRLQ